VDQSDSIKAERKKAVDLFRQCSPLFLAMGDAVRQQLLLDIAEYDDTGVNVQTLTGKTRLSRPAISYHLKILKNSGLITGEKNGTEVFYRLQIENDFAVIKELVETLQDILDAKRPTAEVGKTV